jgi:TonB family protein
VALHTPVELPPPPELIIRPGVPVLATALAPVEVTIPDLQFADLPTIDIPPPPLPQIDLSERPIFIPREVEPVLQNRKEVERFLSQNYPLLLQRAGVGGTAVFEAFLDEEGLVQKTLRVSSSGFSSLDAVAERVFSRMRFSPAYYRFQPTPVWVRMPIRFVAN